MRLGETPVPIPNTTVKTWAAENTILETIWEDRRPPEHQTLRNKRVREPYLENYTLKKTSNILLIRSNLSKDE